MKKKMNHEEHLKFGIALYEMKVELVRLYIVYSKFFGSSHASVKRLKAAIDKIDASRCILDDEYHLVTSREQFLDAGHIYYGGNEWKEKNYPLFPDLYSGIL